MTTPRARGRPTAEDPSVATDLVLDRALAMFAERGFDGMSVRELARDLGVSHNLIPQRIGSKEQLWFAAVDRGFGALAARLAEVLQELPDAKDVTKLRALVVSFVEENATRPALLRIINQEATSPGPRLDHIYARYIEPVRDFGAALLERLAELGDIRPVSVETMYFLMTNGAAGAFALPGLAAKFGDRVSPRQRAIEAVDIIFDGLLP